MISYKVKGVILVVMLSLASIMMPFTVNADTLSTSNITYNYYLTDVVDSTSQLANKNYIYDIDFNFDKSYLGWVSVQMIISYEYTTNDVRQLTLNRALYLNGSNVHTSIVISSNYSGINGGPFRSMSINVNNSNVTPMADLSSLQDIIDLLQDINDHISIDVLSELQDLVANTSLANDYLELISEIRQYNFPIESFNFVSSLMYSYSSKIVDYYLVNKEYTFPIFYLNTGDTLYYTPSSTDNFKMVVFIADNRAWSLNQIKNSLIDFGDLDVDNFNYWGNTRFWFNDQTGYFCSFNIHTTASQAFRIKLKTDLYIIPIYCNSIYKNYVSTEFALQFGLTNSFLDNIQAIANGTNQSNQAASNLENEASEYSDIADDVIGVEEGLTSNFETSVNQIDLNTGLNGFGGNFMTSATWVRTQFDRLTENTPYGSLVVYGLTLGFVLLMLGKVLL